MVFHLQCQQGFSPDPLSEDSKPKFEPKSKAQICLLNPCGLHQWKFMPFGLKNGPAIFQCFMDQVLGCYKWQIMLVYINDIILSYTPLIVKPISKTLIQSSPPLIICQKPHHNSPPYTLIHSVSNLGITTF